MEALRPRATKARMILAMCPRHNAIDELTNCEGNLNEDEGQLDPEGGAQDAVLAEVDAQTLVLGASEDG